jgi:uncharacterized membrane protein YcaP (DUF421 family)
VIHNLFDISLSPLNFIIRGTIVFLFVLILLRIGGKRQLGQMSATEFVAILLISNAVQNSMNGGDNSVTGGLILACTLIFLSWLISFLTFRSRGFSTVFEGTPTLLIHKGKVIEKHMNKERITQNELRVLLRKQNVHNISEVKSAILEADGSFTIEKIGDN